MTIVGPTAPRAAERANIEKLLCERERTARYEGASVVPERPHRNKDNWVSTWIDDGQCVPHSNGKNVAKRAITDDGQLIWMVYSTGRRFAYHSNAATPVEAFEQAADARRKRKRIAMRWPEIVRLRRRVLLGRVRVTVRTQDGREAGLCELGIQGFLRRFGFRGTEFSGRALALLSFIDRQPGYALFVAHLRQCAERESGTGEEPRPNAAHVTSGSPKPELQAA